MIGEFCVYIPSRNKIDLDFPEDDFLKKSKAWRNGIFYYYTCFSIYNYL